MAVLTVAVGSAAVVGRAVGDWEWRDRARVAFSMRWADAKRLKKVELV